MLYIICSIAVILWGCASLSPSTTSSPSPDDVLNALQLPLKTAEERNYFKCTDQSVCTVSDIEGTTVIIEVFSMYCPFCQREASKVNELHEMIEKNGYASDIKIFGIGIKNTPFEVDTFRQKYNVSFPLFSDKDGTILKQLHIKRTPHFIVAQRNELGEFTIVYSKAGKVDEVSSFLKENVLP